MTNGCRLCEIYKAASDPALASQVEVLIKGIPKEEKTSDTEYARRLDICGMCDKLSGNTCLSCGCFVELRAAKSDSHCSRKKW